jgi:hypothetical protein
VNHKVATPYHPPNKWASRNFEQTNQELLQKTINEMGKVWKDKLSGALWAYKTTYKTPIGMTPYQLVYGKTCHLPVELEFKSHWAIKTWRQMQLAELDEWREKAYHNSKIYKERTKRWHDKRIKIKEFTPGDKVLLFNSRVKLFGHGKLRSKWEGSYTLAASHGSITLQDEDGNIFKVNGQRLKVFLEPEMPKLEDLDVLEFISID